MFLAWRQFYDDFPMVDMALTSALTHKTAEAFLSLTGWTYATQNESADFSQTPSSA